MNVTNKLTDLFGLESAIYYIIENHELFVELDIYKDEVKIKSWFQSGQFPLLDSYRAGHVIQKCWEGVYKSAQEAVLDQS
jgi:hypothetical protein